MSASVFGDLAPLRRRPITDLADLKARKSGFRGHPHDESHVRATEPLVDALTLGLNGESYYAGRRNPPYYLAAEGAVDRVWLRQGVVERLLAVDARLRRVGLCLWLLDGWRPLSVQAFFHDQWAPAALKALHPDWPDDRIAAEVNLYWSSPTREAGGPPPHSTGGAVDLTLCWADTGAPLWMGSLFDELSDLANADHFEDRPDLGLSDAEARDNRRLLHWLMVEGGFAPNPNEWWHFSHGDQTWARVQGEPAAFYGQTAPSS